MLGVIGQRLIQLLDIASQHEDLLITGLLFGLQRGIGIGVGLLELLEIRLQCRVGLIGNVQFVVQGLGLGLVPGRESVHFLPQARLPCGCRFEFVPCFQKLQLGLLHGFVPARQLLLERVGVPVVQRSDTDQREQ